MAKDPAKPINSPFTYQICSRYWLEDGSLLLLSDRNLYKLHKTLLLRLSSNLARWTNQVHIDLSIMDEDFPPEVTGCAHVAIPDHIGLRNDDLEALLDHIYHHR